MASPLDGTTTPKWIKRLLGQGPAEALIVDTVDKAGRWDIQVVGFEPKPITRMMFCKACENNQSWKYDHSASSVTQCTRDVIGTFKMREEGSTYFIRMLFLLARGLSQECKIMLDHASTMMNGLPFAVGAFGAPGSDIGTAELDRFQIYHFHYYDPPKKLRDLGP